LARKLDGFKPSSFKEAKVLRELSNRHFWTRSDLCDGWQALFPGKFRKERERIGFVSNCNVSPVNLTA